MPSVGKETKGVTSAVKALLGLSRLKANTHYTLKYNIEQTRKVPKGKSGDAQGS